MGYTHYWYLIPEFDEKEFEKVATDFKKMIVPLQHLGVKLAGRGGGDYPVISPTEIGFNGMNKCGHTERDLGVTWPSKSAKGVKKNSVDTILADIVNGHWFAGANLESRACDGQCSHETFTLDQHFEYSFPRQDGTTYEKEPINKRDGDPANHIGRFFDCTKTAYKPYDLAVNVCLIIAKRHLKHAILVTSDGEDKDWEEARQLCQHFLGYGQKFKLDDENKHRQVTKNHKHDLDKFGWCKGCGVFIGRKNPTFFKLVSVSK